MVVFTPRNGAVHVISFRRANQRERGNMNQKLNPKLNPEKITPDNPEATEEWFTKATPASGVLIELFGNATASEMLKPKSVQIL